MSNMCARFKFLPQQGKWVKNFCIILHAKFILLQKYSKLSTRQPIGSNRIKTRLTLVLVNSLTEVD